MERFSIGVASWAVSSLVCLFSLSSSRPSCPIRIPCWLDYPFQALWFQRTCFEPHRSAEYSYRFQTLRKCHFFLRSSCVSFWVISFGCAAGFLLKFLWIIRAAAQMIIKDFLYLSSSFPLYVTPERKRTCKAIFCAPPRHKRISILSG